MRCLSAEYTYEGTPPILTVELKEFFTVEQKSDTNTSNEPKNKTSKGEKKEKNLVWERKEKSLIIEVIDGDNANSIYDKIINSCKKFRIPYFPNVSAGTPYRPIIFYICLNEDYIETECKISIEQVKKVSLELQEMGYEVIENSSFYSWWNGFKKGEKITTFTYVISDELIERV
jgi:hypothetical protein